ncbi:MAG: carbamoyltransferase HypF [bacterium]
MGYRCLRNDTPLQTAAPLTRIRLNIYGTVQGVGFRPFVYRLATELNLTGWVRNSPNGVQVEVEGDGHRLGQFTDRLQQEKPILSGIDELEVNHLPPTGYTEFIVATSDSSGEIDAVILPDIATCKDCRREIFDPANRRYQYPFTNCTNCGPRYSIIESLPYDRINTTMRRFAMCDECRREYEDPQNRRFHAQPNACPNCGPHLELRNRTGRMLAGHAHALNLVCDLVRKGGILALKGLGGFQLIVDAGNADAVQCLRDRKNRPDKPLALMYPNLTSVANDCELTLPEKTALTSSASPIVLLKRKLSPATMLCRTAGIIAPDNPYLGVMLPYTPLHHLLIADLGGPIVATSGNLSDEPICTDEREALHRLRDIADLFLVHDRPIARHVDDSIVRVIADRPVVLRSARGYAPTVIDLSESASDCLAVGAQLKNSIAISKGRRTFVSQHIGDLDSKPAFDAMGRVIGSLISVYNVNPSIVACDLHPDYQSTSFASAVDAPCHPVQHHYAHVLSCMAENHLEPPVLGVSFDGTGLGTDDTIWGGEFLRVVDDSFERVAHLRCFRLPGGDTAIREPRRAALSLLYEAFGDDAFGMRELSPVKSFTTEELRILRTVLSRGVNAPFTSSAGRLFDAVSSLVGLCHKMSFEGQAAMLLEFAAESIESADTYEFSLETRSSPYVLDWEPMLRQICSDLRVSAAPAIIAAKFHNTLAGMIAEIATRSGETRIALTGGCFQNKYLTERALAYLHRSGLEVFRHGRVPPNDGGIALGQIMAACRQQRKGDKRVSGSSRKDT